MQWERRMQKSCSWQRSWKKQSISWRRQRPGSREGSRWALDVGGGEPAFLKTRWLTNIVKNVSVCVCVFWNPSDLLVKPRGYDRRVEDFFEHLSQPLMPPQVCPFVARGSPSWSTQGRFCTGPAFASAVSTTKSIWGFNAFFLAVYDDLLTEVCGTSFCYTPCLAICCGEWNPQSFSWQLSIWTYTFWDKAQRRNMKPPSSPPPSMPTASAGRIAWDNRCSQQCRSLNFTYVSTLQSELQKLQQGAWPEVHAEPCAQGPPDHIFGSFNTCGCLGV